MSCVRKYALVSGICHLGSLHSGHYTAFARDDVCGGWLHLNDKAVTRTTLKALNGPHMFYFIKVVRSLKIRGGSELISERLSYPVYTGFGLQAAGFFCFF